MQRVFNVSVVQDDEKVSIPQAVGTVATVTVYGRDNVALDSFNTASGRYCCNAIYFGKFESGLVECFNTASGRYCCNLYDKSHINQ